MNTQPLLQGVTSTQQVLGKQLCPSSPRVSLTPAAVPGNRERCSCPARRDNLEKNPEAAKPMLRTSGCPRSPSPVTLGTSLSHLLFPLLPSLQGTEGQWPLRRRLRLYGAVIRVKHSGWYPAS